MNGKDQGLHIDCSNNTQQRRRVSGGGSSNLSCEHGTETGLESTEDQDQRAIAATRLAFRYRQKVTFCELMAIPVMFGETDDACVQSAPALPPCSSQWDVMHDALRNWAPEGVRFNLLRQLPWVTQFEHWEPETTRFLLEHALPGGATLRQELALSAHQATHPPASRLGFVLVLASSERGWPRRYLIRLQADERHRAVLRFVLEADGARVANLGSVLPASEAITQGVCDWLTLEIELSGHDTWNLHLDRADADRRWIHLSRAGEPSSLLRVPLRTHLTGSTGLSRIASHMGLLAARQSEVQQ
jgi:hypothetical protein